MTLHVAIVGGGLGGLAAALFLRKADIDVTVYEQARELHEVGAGIVVPPNMVRPPCRDWRIESWTARGEISDLLREFDGTCAMTLTRNWRLTFRVTERRSIVDLDLEDYH